MNPIHSLAEASPSAAITPSSPPPPVPPASSLSPLSAPAPIHISSAPAPGPDATPVRQSTPVARPTTPSATLPGHHHILPPIPPPIRKDTNSSISTQATTATMASTETNNTSYSADTSPNLHQSIFSVEDGSDVSNTRRPSRRRTGPLSQQSRERAALIRKLGACNDCRRRRVAVSSSSHFLLIHNGRLLLICTLCLQCHPSHHNMSWEDVVHKFQRPLSPTLHDIAPSLAGRPLSPASALSHAQPLFTHDPQEMDIDSIPSHHLPGRPPLSDARIRTPLPSGPRLEKSLSLPGIESLKNDLQTNVSRMLSTASRSRYNAVQALLLFWQDDDDALNISAAVNELAEVFDKYYHYTFHTQTIPSSSESCKSSWRWLSRQLNDFAEDRDQRDVLKIVYYVGHTYLDGNRDMILAR